MKKVQKIMPLAAFTLAAIAAYATTPINGFTTEVWTKPNPNSQQCNSSDCQLEGTINCAGGVLYYSDSQCTNQVQQAFRP